MKNVFPFIIIISTWKRLPRSPVSLAEEFVLIFSLSSLIPTEAHHLTIAQSKAFVPFP